MPRLPSPLYVRASPLAGRSVTSSVAIGRHQIEPYLLPAIGALVDAAVLDHDVAVANRVVGETENGGDVMWRLAGGGLVADLELDVASALRVSPRR